MPEFAPEYRRRVEELLKRRGQYGPNGKPWYSNWESHVRGMEGKMDHGGFLESMEYAITKDWKLSEAQKARVDDIHQRVVCGVDSRKDKGYDKMEKPDTGISTLTRGEFTAIRESEGWRIKVKGLLIGIPLIQEHASAVCQWLDSSWRAIEKIVQGTAGAPVETPKVEEDFPDLEDDSTTPF